TRNSMPDRIWYGGFSKYSPPILGQNSSPNSSFVTFLNSQNSSYIRVFFSNTLSQISSLFPCYSLRISGRCFALKVSEQKLGISQIQSSRQYWNPWPIRAVEEPS
ncbi:hypothetical protein F2P56_012186, partial [Juglans regia]